MFIKHPFIFLPLSDRATPDGLAFYVEREVHTCLGLDYTSTEGAYAQDIVHTVLAYLMAFVCDGIEVLGQRVFTPSEPSLKDLFGFIVKSFEHFSGNLLSLQNKVCKSIYRDGGQAE